MRRIVLIAGLALLLVALPAFALSPGETVLVTRATDGSNASGSDTVNLSADGRCAVFGSTAANLPGANGFSQVYLRETDANTTTLVSRTPGGAGGDGHSRNPVITPDCRFVVWDSEATDLTATVQSERLAYRRDLQTGTTIIVSQTSAGAVADAAATTPVISADGNRVVFSSAADNLADDDDDSVLHNDLFVRDVSAGTTSLVNRSTAEAADDGFRGAGNYPTISADGRLVAFDSDADNLGGGDNAGGKDVFVRDLDATTTTFVSRNTGASGAAGDSASALPRISGDGTRVAFISLASNFEGGEPIVRQRVYVRDLATHETILVSRANGAGGEPANQDSGGQPGLQISADGTRVAFQSQATNLPDDSSGGTDFDVFVRDLSASTTEMVARSSSGVPAGSSQWITISSDGTHVAFLTASSLVADDADGQLDVYLRGLGGSGGPGPTPTPTPSPTATPGGPAPAPPAAPAAVTLRGEAAFARGTANDLYLACTTLDLYLVDVLPAGRRVSVTGAADLRLAGQTADILLDGRRVGRATIRPDGSFAARVAAPSRRRRARARYQARIGSTASQRLRLARRMVATTLTRSGSSLVLRGVVNAPRARRQPAIAVERFLSCRRREKVKVPKVVPNRRGRFSVRIKVPAGAQAVLYRARTKVPARAGRRATKGTFTLPRAADVG